MYRLIFYLLSIIAANVITAALPPLEMGIFIVPYGTFLIGATFILRDLVQERWGRKNTYLCIAAALLLSALLSKLNGDSLAVTYASALAFAVSESTDTEVYSRLRLSFPLRVLWSGLAGGIFDSAIFVIAGLSPLGAGYLPWAAVPAAIVGQIAVKTVMQMAGAGTLSVPLIRRLLRAQNA